MSCAETHLKDRYVSKYGDRLDYHLCSLKAWVNEKVFQCVN